MIWAPADTLASPASYLMISCVQNISRLQLVTAQPIDSRRVKVRLGYSTVFCRAERHAADNGREAQLLRRNPWSHRGGS